MERISVKSRVCGLGALALGFALTGCVVEGPPAPRPVIHEDRPIVYEPQPAPAYVEPTPVYEGETVYIDEGRHGRLHDYYYYPDAALYFDPGLSIWFWRDGYNWASGRDLPRRFHYDPRHRISLHTDARRPYEVHDRFLRGYREHSHGGYNNGPGHDNHPGGPGWHGDGPGSHDNHPGGPGGWHGDGPGSHDNDHHDNDWRGNDRPGDDRPGVRGGAPDTRYNRPSGSYTRPGVPGQGPATRGGYSGSASTGPRGR